MSIFAFNKNTHKMKKKFISIITVLCLSLSSIADEGMWLPQLLQAINEKDMQASGLKLTAKDLYDINNSSSSFFILNWGDLKLN